MRRTVFLVFVFLAVSIAAEEPLRGRRGPDASTLQAVPPAGLSTAVEAPVVATTSLEVATAAVEPSPALLIGHTRELGAAVTVRTAQTAAASGTWRGTVRVPGAERTRLRLAVRSGDARMWVYDRNGAEWASFDPSLAHDGELWTPSVGGEAIVLEIAGDVDLDITGAAAMREVAPDGTECLRDAACATGLPDFGKAIGRYQYIRGSGAYLCSGGLLNNDGGKQFDPLFLTANHCLSSASEAATVEVIWDYRAPTCGGVPPLRSTLPRTNGATLLTTSSASDTTLLRLASLPAGRWFLGWDPNVPAAGTQLFRFAHPNGGAMKYSTTAVTTTGGTCATLARPVFLYSTLGTGTVASGSSGAPVMYDQEQGYVVGQLYGQCGTNLADECSILNRQVDGAFASSYDVLKPYIRPAAVTPAPCGACVSGPTTACLLGNRFKVTLAWKDYTINAQGAGSVIRYADNKPVIDPTHGPVSESSFWSMYSFNPDSIEALVRMIRGANINNHFWVFITGFASAEYTVTVEDTQTCRTWQKTMASGTTSMIKDFTAFPFP